MGNQEFLNTGSFDIKQGSFWIKNLRSLSIQLGCTDVLEYPTQSFEQIQRHGISVVVIGSPNTGRSTLINSLLERDLLPVSALPSSQCFQIDSSHEESEHFIVNGLKKPLDELLQYTSSANDENIGGLHLYISSKWLEQYSITLTEGAALDATDEELDDVVEEMLKSTDIALLTIDALMPIKRSDSVLMIECAKRDIPLIVALTKGSEIHDNDKEEVISYVKEQVESCSSSFSVIVINNPKRTSVYCSGIPQLRAVIEDIINNKDIKHVRELQFAHSILQASEIIISSSESALEAQKKSSDERKRFIERKKQEIDSENLIWLQIEQDLTSHRQSIEKQIRKHLESNSDSILETLFYDLERSNDVKAWWNRDLPYRLSREFKSIAGQLSSAIRQSITNDLNWLQTELMKRFKYEVQTISEIGVKIDSSRIDQKELPLSDSHKFKIITRLGTVSVVVLGIATIGSGGIAGIGIAAGALAGVGAEIIAKRNTITDKKKVMEELNKIIAQAISGYAQEVSKNLKSGYAEIVSKLKRHQLRWQQAQLQALKSVEKESCSQVDKTNYPKILMDIQSIAKQVKDTFEIK